MGNDLTTSTQIGAYTRAPISKKLGIAQEQFRFALDTYTESIKEASIINSYIEGDHYDYSTLQALAEAGRPAEMYNLILRIKRLLVGYYKKTVTTAVAEAVTIEDTVTARLHNDHFKLAQRLSKWDSFIMDVTSDLITTGQGAWTIEVVPTGRTDHLGRTINNIQFSHVESTQVMVDPRAKQPDNSDAKYIHYWEFLTYDEVVSEFGKSKADKLRLQHSDFIESSTGDYLISGDYTGEYLGLHNFEYWKNGEAYFVVRTYSYTEEGKIQLLSWHGDLELGIEELDTEMFPVQAINVLKEKKSRRYYSPLREACASQDAINQALLQFQKLVGEARVFADHKALAQDEVSDFNKKLKTIGEILFVRNIAGIKVEHLTAEAQAHLNKMYTSIQLILEVIGINEAFLGHSKAGDSGRKFEGQRSASENTLEYLTTPIELIHSTLLLQCIHYTSVYKQATEQLRFLDEFGKARWELVNLPFLMPTGEVDEEGSPVLTEYREEVVGKDGVKRYKYVNEKAKALDDIAVEVSVHTAPYDDTDTVELAFIQEMMNGQAGQIMANANPAGIVFIYSLLAKNLKTKNSEEIAKYLQVLSQKLGAFNVEDPRLYQNNGSAPQGSSGAIEYAGGTTNDNQPTGYNQPITKSAPNAKE